MVGLRLGLVLARVEHLVTTMAALGAPPPTGRPSRSPRIGGQFIAASSNMFAYCEPWPEKTAATLPRASRSPDARKWAPCFGSVHFAADALARSWLATAVSDVVRRRAVGDDEADARVDAGTPARRALAPVNAANASATARCSAANGLTPSWPPLRSAPSAVAASTLVAA